MKKIILYLVTVILILQSTTMVNAQADYKECLDGVMTYLADNTENPDMGAEWTILALARGGYQNEDFFESYYNNIKSYVEQKASAKLHRVKSTENSRVIIALSAAGYGAQNIGGYNLVEPLYSFDYTVGQGINGAIYALIALDSKGYILPETSDNSRERMIEYIVSQQKDDGGWALSGSVGDADTTSMAIQALIPYYPYDEELATVVERAITFLSEKQEADGGYSSWGLRTAESCAQVLCALADVRISFDDERFVKNSNSLVDALLSYYNDNEKAFGHTSSDNINRMATEQAAYALVAYHRMENGKRRLFDMNSEIANSLGTEGINVSFWLVGTDMGKENAKYITWLPQGNYSMHVQSNVWDLFNVAMKSNQLSFENGNGSYIASIKAPDAIGGYELAEGTNGKNSGWVYEVNDEEATVAMDRYVLSDGDSVIVHYVNDFAKESDGIRPWADAGSSVPDYKSVIKTIPSEKEAPNLTVIYKFDAANQSAIQRFMFLTSQWR